MVDRIKSPAKIEKYHCRNKTMVGRTHDVVVNNRNGGFCGVILSIGRMTFRKKTVLSCVVTYTINKKLDYLRDEAQIRDGSVRFYVWRIKRRLLNSGMYNSMFV